MSPPVYRGDVLFLCPSVHKIMSAPYLRNRFKDFHETCVRCSPDEGDVQNSCSDHTGSRSMSQRGDICFCVKTNLVNYCFTSFNVSHIYVL